MPSPCDSCKTTCGDGKASCGSNCKCGPNCSCSKGGDKKCTGGTGDKKEKE